MTKRSVVSLLVAVAGLLATLSGQQPQERQAPKGNYVPGELLVGFARGANDRERSTLFGNGNGTGNARWIRKFEDVEVDYLRLPPGMTVERAIAVARGHRDVKFAQPNYIRQMIQVANTPNDPFWLDGSLWGLKKIQVQSAWTNFTTGNGSVVVAGIDTGIDYNHADLSANMWRNPLEVPGNGIDDDNNGYVDDVFGIDTVNHDSNPMDDQGHGTHTAGTIAAVGNNGIGVVGVNWNAKLLACKFLSADGYGTDAGAIECFNYIVALKTRGVNIRVSSNSWGGPREGTATALEAAIDAAGTAGIINIFGAGNDGSNNDITPFDPASMPSPSIVSVASSGQTDRRSSFSNYGPISVDLAAPGENILSTYPQGGFTYLSGTSMATPHVAGVAALLASLDPGLPVSSIKSLLLDNVDKLSRWNNLVVSGGRLNAYRSASAVTTGAPNELPTVSITGPAEGTTFTLPANITLTADASDSDGSIVSVTFYANGAPIGGDSSSPYSVLWSNVAPGNYTLTAVATDNVGAVAAAAPVHVTVLPNSLPTVSITNPIEGSTYSSPATVIVDATASDVDGFVQQVVFYANGAVVGTDATSPYSLTWNPPLGSYTLTAVATDNLGAPSTSAPVRITVEPLAGRINVALASNGGVASASSTLNANYPPSGANNGDRKGVNWGAGGGWNDGTTNAGPDWLQIDFAGQKLIEQVDIFSMQDNYSAPVEPTPTMTFTSFGLRAFQIQYWDGAAWVDVPGAVVTNNNLVWRQFVFAPLTTSRIRAFITGALNGSARVMELEAWGVASGANAPPNVSIVNPSGGSSFIAPGSITINAVATDDDGAVQEVTFYANGAPIGTDTTSPFSVTWDNVPAGSYSLMAIATDNAGATTASTPVFVSVVSNTPPTVLISSPSNGATFTAGATVSVNATAEDADGSVTSVAFYLDEVLLGTDTSSPYSVTWSNVTVGSHTLTATATDNLGATANSTAIGVTVNPNLNRMNFALSSNGGVASASSTLSGNYPASGANNGDRKGLNWGAGGGWNDGTPNTSPDWLQIDFNGSKTVDEINVFSMQDNYNAPVEPTPAMTFTTWGMRAFDVQYWNGTAWVAIPGASITNNGLVWRQFLVSPITTTKIRLNITAALNGYSRVIELEAWGPVGGGPPPPPNPTRTNVALAANGGVASASSTLSGNYPASGANNGDRKGVSWGAGGGWNDGTPNASPDWLQIDFNGSKTIDEVNVFSMQDNYGAPVEPTPTMTFTSWGLRAFDIQYWNGTAWVPIPGASITNNNLVWRQFLFSAITTTKIRLNVTAALNGYSRVIEFEAWGQ